MNMMSDERLGVRIGPPDPICTETPVAREARRHGKRPTTDEVRESIIEEARRFLGPYSRKVQRQRGLPTDGGRIGGPDDTYCNPKTGSLRDSF